MYYVLTTACGTDFTWFHTKTVHIYYKQITTVLIKQTTCYDNTCEDYNIKCLNIYVKHTN